MRIIQIDKDIDWLPKPNQLSTVISDVMPDRHLITCSFVLAFSNDEIILTDLHARGWDIPGGHIERGESAEEAVIRELYEETGAKILEPELLGLMEIEMFGDKPENYKYPFPKSYMAFFWSNIIHLDDIQPNDEIRGRGLLKPEQVLDVPWIKDNYKLYQEALKRARS
jgi:8-oxo-dGTP pyrophosphatase MutT (NUDIX family)